MDEALRKRIDEKKARLDALRPFDAAALARLREFMLVELAYNSNAIEGNTLTRSETRLVIEDGLTVGGKTLREHLEAVNHVAALGAVEREAKEKKVSEPAILYLHSLVVKGILGRWEGAYREQDVRIGGSAFKPPSFRAVPGLVKDFVEELSERAGKTHVVDLAAFAHFRLVNIHPFLDGNGRTARLLMNLVLLQHGLPITIIQRAERKQYYRALEDANGGNFEPFSNFVARAVERSLELYLEALQTHRPKDEELLTLRDAARGTPYSADYLSLLARWGRLEAVKMGRNWRASRKAVQRYVLSARKNAKPPTRPNTP